MTSTPDVSPEPDVASAGSASSGSLLSVAVSHPTAQVAVVRAVGEIDLGGAPEWRRALVHACADLDTCGTVARAGSSHPQPSDPPAPRLVCDLTGVTFLGAAGLAVLVEIVEHTAHHGIGLRLVADSRPVRRVLELTEIDRTLSVERRLLPAISSPAAHDC